MPKIAIFCCMELKIAHRTYFFSQPQVMGIVNCTPDSFYAKSRHTTPAEVYTTVEQMIKEGAAIIDLGASSSRPGAIIPSVEEEWSRLSPVLMHFRRHFPEVAVSVDSYHSEVVERAFDAIGPCMVNDISAGEDDPCMFEVAARLQLPVVAMHKRGTPQTMHQYTDYENIVVDVHNYFASVLERAREAGVLQIILDPGFGFAKTTEQNYTLLSRLPELFDFSNVLRLIGISRKSMVYMPLVITPDEALPATSALHLYALQQGVDILRVHDVKEAVQMVRLHAMLSHTEIV